MRHSTLPLSLALVVVCAGVAALATALPSRRSADAQAPTVDFDLYLRRQDGRSADPVNLILIGDRDVAAVAVRLAGLLRWGTVAGSDMAFIDHGTTRWAEVQLGTVAPGGLRRHMRIAGSTADSQRWGPYMLAGVHHDLPIPCGHVGDGFDVERDALASAMRAAGYSVAWIWLGNDGPVQHCNGAITHGDGWAVVIDLRRERDMTAASTEPPAPVASPSPSPSPSPSAANTPAPTVSPTPAPSATPSPTPTPIVWQEPPAPPEGR